MRHLTKEEIHTAREAAFKIIYQMDMGNTSEALAVETILEEENLSAGGEAFCRELVQGVQQHQEEIDQMIQAHTTGWRLDRMMSVNRNLLRVAVYEMEFGEHITAKGAIDEAIELAKVYGEDNSPGFINSILDKIMKR